jgi:hypothetical protein
MDIWCQRLWIAGGKIVESADLVSLTGEMVRKRRAEESRGSSDEEVHEGRL